MNTSQALSSLAASDLFCRNCGEVISNRKIHNLTCSHSHRKSGSTRSRQIAEGSRPNPMRKEVWQASVDSRSPEWYQKHNRLVGDLLKDKPRKGLCAKGPQHPCAKFYIVRGPDGVVHSFTNLNEFVRRHSRFFLAEDLQWKRGQCRAAKGINQLFNRAKRVPGSWKGWTAVSDGMDCSDPLQRQNSDYPHQKCGLQG